MFHSAEARWFLSGAEKWDELLYWFTRQGRLPLVQETGNYVPDPDAAPLVKQERPRTDDYLVLPNCETVGVKQRQGRLEVKALVAGPRPFALGAVAGRVDAWVKWSLQPSAAIALPLEADLQQSGRWRQVEKRRCTQKYAHASGGLTAVSPDAWPEAGCSVELTLLRVAAGVPEWVTFGFEAFGSAAQAEALLIEAVTHFFIAHGPAPLRLAEQASLSYPAWLTGLERDKRQVAARAL
jgi:hypothetical protein